MLLAPLPNDDVCPKAPELCPNGVAPDPIVDGWPKAGVAADDPNPGLGEGAVGVMPKTEGSSWYFFARLRNICSSLPLYLAKSLSTSASLLGFFS